MSEEVSEVVIIVLAGTFLMLLLVGFIVYFFILQQHRQQRFQQEKAALKAQFEQEILTSQNEIKEETMKYISRELHDNVVQMLSLVKIQLHGLSTDLPQQSKISTSKNYLSTAIADLRALSKTLNTNNVLEEGLANTIAFELQRIQKTGLLHTHFSNATTALCLDSNHEIIVFRIVQELLQNSIKHAKAKNIWVLLEHDTENCILVVKDDGIGFDFQEKLSNKGFESGSGLHNMLYRANLLKGSFEVTRSDAGGTQSVLKIPQLRPL